MPMAEADLIRTAPGSQPLSMTLSQKVVQFTVLNKTSGVRQGSLQLVDHVLNTPAIFITTQRLTVPHLTPDTFQRTLRSSDYAGILVDTEALLEDNAVLPTTSPLPLERLINYTEGSVPIIVSSRDHVYCSSAEEDIKMKTMRNGSDRISVLTTNGVTPLNIKSSYQAIAASLRPDAIISPVDHYSPKTARFKRIKRASENTAEYLKSLEQLGTCIVPSVHLHTDNGEPEEKQTTVVNEMTKRISSVAESSLASLIFQDIASLNTIKLPPTLAILARGPIKPVDILSLLKAGADFIETSHFTDVATLGTALTLTLQSLEKIESTSLDLKDVAYFEDFTPISTDCGCIACSGPDKTTRAYVHHLIMNSEMLGPIYLASHNLWQLARVFRELRKSLQGERVGNPCQGLASPSK